MIILNGRKVGDLDGELTCYEWNGSNAIDVTISSLDLYRKIKSFDVLDPVWFSDHCPIITKVQ